jgi:hypothetical protein
MMKTQRPLVHGTLLQQSLIMVQLCPYSAQTGPPSIGGRGGASGLSPSIELPSGGEPPPSVDGGGDPQTPRVDPGGNVQGSPGQQSAPVVQVPPRPTHSPPQTKGGTPAPASAVKFGLGTQGKPQQSALVAQVCPALDPASSQGCAAIIQRGMPRRSCWHASGTWLTLPEQQLFSALHELMASLHTAPAGRHACPLSQRPTGSAGFALLQVTPVAFGVPTPPQQSALVPQISPVG